MRNYLLGVCLAFLVVLLCLGLWPFHAPDNDVTWLQSSRGLGFHHAGAAHSTSTFALPASDFTLEVWARPAEWRGWGTLLDLRNQASGEPLQFTLGQLTEDLKVQATTGSRPYWTKKHLLEILAVLSPQKSTFIAVTVGPGRIRVYADGALVKDAVWFPHTDDVLVGRLIVGDSFGQSNGWNGEVGGVAIYAAELDEAATRRHFDSWRNPGGPTLLDADKNLALYLMDQQTGRVIPDVHGKGPDLVMPETYTVLNKQVLGLVWEEFTGSTGYWKDVLNNIVGFIPFGFVVFAYLSGTTGGNRAAWFTCAIGLSVSLCIELLQLLLPTRESSSTDLCLNTLGTWIGVAGFRRWGPMLGLI